MDKAKFEGKFRHYLKLKRYTQAELAEVLHVTRYTVNKWITGVNQVSIENLYKLCDLFQLNEKETIEFFELAGREEYLDLTKEDGSRSTQTPIEESKPVITHVHATAQEKILLDRSTTHIDTVRKFPTSTLNPYAGRAMLTDTTMFFGREEELDSLFARLAALQSCSIVGQRRIGKSSLLYYLCQPEVYNNRLPTPPQSAFAYLDLQTIGRPTCQRFFSLVLHSFAQASSERLPTAYEPTYDGFRTFVEDSHEVNWGLVLCLDEFEIICGRGEFDSDFFSFLRGLGNSYNLAYVTTSISPLHELCHTGQVAASQFWNIFTQLQLDRLKTGEARELITTPFTRAEMTLSPEDIDLVLSLADHHPLLLQIACYHLYEAIKKGGVGHAQVKAKFHQEAEPYLGHIQ